MSHKQVSLAKFRVRIADMVQKIIFTDPTFWKIWTK